MTSTVYFSDMRSKTPEDNKGNKIRRLLEAAGGRTLRKGDLTAVKLHFGERGCDGFIRPIFVRKAVDWAKEKGAKPFLTDTNTLYTGSRKNSVDHLLTAIEHGFGFEVTGAPLVIADGLRSGNFQEIPVRGEVFSSVKIASDIRSSDSMVVLSHFKGHVMAGFGGAVKNLAMGCAPAEGKKEQHSARMSVDDEKCVGCGRCFRNCPVKAISMTGGKAVIDKDVCIGCGECLTVCPASAISLDWRTDVVQFHRRMAEYALGAVADKETKTVFLNFIMDVTPQCDCVPWSDASVVPDIGLAASTDPVALDKACLDMVISRAGTDPFKDLYDKIDSMEQLRHGEAVGLGHLDYVLREM
ncbi:4Fe-4S ferredoxin iron-sulfur binding domain protein [Dethiosulfovibrio peptidovorans DSM 11002]|uniref:4Fe-4S ferredoxin iron-sulfur binding domain protein n=1 Tax=Dethiosulfovibrio peptidovorans DSM 11002 TaxID=469381 RepID=D2Z7B5_9BACT|nr:DUF362 domain-containing protein [Dethiosulfovibrio peptidovorans]EFC91362.1 4Fe-4S ferredoxin iron-sulfur binding domain protein [Dethiosulfovibrio peptidovorans DSM 11002]